MREDAWVCMGLFWNGWKCVQMHGIAWKREGRLAIGGNVWECVCVCARMGGYAWECPGMNGKECY